MLWQEARSAGIPEQALYLVDDAVDFVHGGLPGEMAGRVSADEVRTMLEWSMHHSQVVVARSGAAIPVLGGPGAVAFLLGQSEIHGWGWNEADVTAVLDLEAAYLVSIGAVGEAVEEEST
jgi:hypothetical protein